MYRSLLNWNPVNEFQQIEEMFERAFGTNGRSNGEGTQVSYTLPVDVYERDNRIFVKAAVPGMSADDLDVSIDKNILTIRGETKADWGTEDQSTKVFRREYRYGSFSRSIRLPENIDVEQVNAEFNNGFVTVSVPYMVQEKPQAFKVPVKTVGQGSQVSEQKSLTADAQQSKRKS